MSHRESVIAPCCLVAMAMGLSCHAAEAQCTDFEVEAPGSWTSDTCVPGPDCEATAAPEHVYEVSIPTDGSWTIALSTTSFDTLLELATSDWVVLEQSEILCSLGSSASSHLTAGAYFVTVRGGSVQDCGAYTLEIAPVVQPAGLCPNTGSCCVPNASPGCNDPTCCALVCLLDPFCCDVTWDVLCAEQANGLCDGCGVGCPGSDCCAGGESPGCQNPDCTFAVCSVEPFCCQSAWDQVCIELAEELCGDLCSSCPGEGSCCEAHATPGCDDAACCEVICEFDPFCCDVEWDVICVDEAIDSCPPLCPAPDVMIDIKPGSCPNSFNRACNGVLPVGLLGTEHLDVAEVDLASLVISRADGVGSSAVPQTGPPGPHTVVEDVGTPFWGEACDCHDVDGDGLADLSIKFGAQALVEALELGDLPTGELVELVLGGALLNGVPFTASDCIRLVPPGTPPGAMTVQTSPPGAWVEVTPLDDQLDGGGFGPFERTFPLGTLATLNVESTHLGAPFEGWVVNGRLVRGGGVMLPLIIFDKAVEVRAVYSAPGDDPVGTPTAPGPDDPAASDSASESELR